MPTKSENGHDFPAAAYAYVPDDNEPSTWKLRLWEDTEKKETAKQVGMAVAALGEGFRGNKVEIPKDDLPKVKAKVLAAWKDTHPDASDDDIPDVLKKRVGKFRQVLRKMWYAGEGFNLDDDDDNKPAHDLATALQMDEYSDQVLAVLTAALADTIDSILDDPTVTDKQSQIDAALQDYSQRLQAVGITKAGRKMSGQRLDNLKQIHQSLGDLLSDLDTSGDNSGKGDDDVIDKTKLAPEVRKYLEEVEKRAQDAEAKVTEFTKSAGGAGETEEEILKRSLPEPLRKKFEEMEKQAKAAEDIAKRERDERLEREFIAKARGYKGLSVKPDEFGKVLKSLAEKAPDDFAKLDEVLKAADEAIAKSDLFKETGRGGSGPIGGALDQLNSIAKEKVTKSAGKVTHEQAFAEAIRENPDLYKKYREEA